MALRNSVKRDGAATKDGGWGETVRMIVWALVIAFVIRSFLFQPFNIPSSSMVPTLLVGDYVFITKFTYGYSRYSFPFSLPLFDGRIMGASPERGDVAVFKTPADNSTDFIKRVIGLPGDTIQLRHDVLYINGDPVPREPMGEFMAQNSFGLEERNMLYRETLPNGVTYMTLHKYEDGPGDNTGVYKVPEGHYFMMGDNRDNSADSRVPSAVGYVPYQNFLGKAQIIFFSVNPKVRFWEVWRWGEGVRWSRLFSGLYE